MVCYAKYNLYISNNQDGAMNIAKTGPPVDTGSWYDLIRGYVPEDAKRDNPYMYHTSDKIFLFVMIEG